MQSDDEIRGGLAEFDERWMEEALRLARLAEVAGEVPVGAVVVCEGRGVRQKVVGQEIAGQEIVGRGWNQVVSLKRSKRPRGDPGPA